MLRKLLALDYFLIFFLLSYFFEKTEQLYIVVVIYLGCQDVISQCLEFKLTALFFIIIFLPEVKSEEN